MKKKTKFISVVIAIFLVLNVSMPVMGAEIEQQVVNDTGTMELKDETEMQMGLEIPEELTLEPETENQTKFVSGTEDIIPNVGKTSRATDSNGFSYQIDSVKGYSILTDYSGNVTNITIPENLGGYPVRIIGDFAFAVRRNLTSIKIPSSVTSIGDHAFWNCDSLTSIEIPSSVTSIGDSAFLTCVSLTSIKIPNGVISIGNGAFLGCLSLTSIEIPSSVTSIGGGAFLNCSSLTSIEIPSSVISIGGSAFYGTKWMENKRKENPLVIINNILIDASISEGDVKIPSSVTSIGDNAFQDCSSLTSIEIPSSVISIGSHAFWNCDSLTSIEIPSSVTSIGSYAFWFCSSLMSIEIPSSVTSIGSYAFDSCYYNFIIMGKENSYAQTYAEENRIQFNIIVNENYTITYYLDNGINNSNNPSTYTVETEYVLQNPTKNGYIFDGWYAESTFRTRVTEIPQGTTGNLSLYAKWIKNETDDTIIPQDENGIPDNAFYNALLETVNSEESYLTSEDLERITELDISHEGIESLKGIDYLTNLEILRCYNNPFTKLVELDLTSLINLKLIKDDSFAYCENLKIVMLPEGLEELGVRAFDNCPALEAVELPDSITKLGHMAFAGCEKITEFKIPSKVKTLSGTFYGCKNLKSIIIPNGVTELYATFAFCTSLENITIPNSVTSIGYSTFRCCKKLSSLVIPASVNNIQGGFLKNSGVKELKVETGNSHYVSVENVIYTKDMTKLIVTAARTDIKIQDGVKIIGDCAYSAIRTDGILKIPEGVTTLEQVFYNCADIQVEIPDSVTSISEYLFGLEGDAEDFDNAESLKFVIYCNKGSFAEEFAKSWSAYSSNRVMQIYKYIGEEDKDAILINNIQLNKIKVMLPKGGKETLGITINPENASNKKVIWKTSNENVVMVDSYGNLTAKKPGTATVTVTASDGSGKYATCKVTVGYKVNYKLFGGKNNIVNPTIVYKEKIKLKAPSRSGYIFKGWYTDKKYKKKISIIQSNQSKDITLYAKWEKVKVGKSVITKLQNKKSKKIFVQVKQIKNSDGYEITYSTDKKLKKGQNVIDSKGNKKTISKNLEKGKTYYIKVRAYKKDSTGKKVYGKYSVVNKIKINK